MNTTSTMTIRNKNYESILFYNSNNNNNYIVMDLEDTFACNLDIVNNNSGKKDSNLQIWSSGTGESSVIFY